MNNSPPTADQSPATTVPETAPGLLSFQMACPICHTALEPVATDEQRCLHHGITCTREEGIWRCLTPERAAYFQQFMVEYTAVRRAEGRGMEEPAYYRALPFQDLSGHFQQDWQIRARSYQMLLERVVQPLEGKERRPLKVLDLGAGNGWLAYRLAQRNHHVAAVDLQTDRFDGLGAYVHYDAHFVPVQAEFDHLPFAANQVDLVVFNGSFHYATTYVESLRESLRVLKQEGTLVILDSPVYQDGTSGIQMVQERETYFKQTYGFASNALPSENYLTYRRLDELAEALGIEWQIHRPFYGWRWALRPWRARLRGHREPAQFMLIVGQRQWVETQVPGTGGRADEQSN
jgi:ubiquinone/menaquinone biosynthesis C-methylase UbiE